MPLREDRVRTRLVLHPDTVARAEKVSQALGVNDYHDTLIVAAGIGLRVLEAVAMIEPLARSADAMAAISAEFEARLKPEVERLQAQIQPTVDRPGEKHVLEP